MSRELSELEIREMFEFRYKYGMSLGQLSKEYGQRREFTAKILKGERLRHITKELFEGIKNEQ